MACIHVIDTHTIYGICISYTYYRGNSYMTRHSAGVLYLLGNFSIRNDLLFRGFPARFEGG